MIEAVRAAVGTDAVVDVFQADLRNRARRRGRGVSDPDMPAVDLGAVGVEGWPRALRISRRSALGDCGLASAADRFFDEHGN